jgi:hypothetical protein
MDNFFCSGKDQLPARNPKTGAKHGGLSLGKVFYQKKKVLNPDK